MKLKKVVVLGSTGSIGINALKVIDRFPKKFQIIGLSAHNNVDLLIKQISQFRPRYAAVRSEHIALLKKRNQRSGIKIFDSATELNQLVQDKDVDIVVIGIEGSAALQPFLMAARCGKRIAPANKEALVMAGSVITKEAKRYKATIIPVDSEQSAIFQCLKGSKQKQVRKVYLTASGGALRDVEAKNFDQIPLCRILKHPRWKMGDKITVDSATLMNKGLEVIEAMELFNLRPKDIKVVIHPESIIHSMVEFVDGSVMAQLGAADMRIPIQYALSYPDRLSTNLPSIDFAQQQRLTFYEPDFKKFPSLRLCYEVAKKRKTYGAVLNAANEVAVKAFLQGNIKFSQIYLVVNKVVKRHRPPRKMNLVQILKADQWARQQAQKLIEE